jgi:hypothetical protein
VGHQLPRSLLITAQARVQKPSLAPKAREKVVVESSEEEDDEDEATMFYNKSYSRPKPERFCYGCARKDHFIRECLDPKKIGDKDKSKDKKRKIYFKSDKKEKAFLGMANRSDSFDNEEEERQGMVDVAIASSSLTQASTPLAKASSSNSMQVSTSLTKESSSSLSLFNTKFSDFKHYALCKKRAR